MYSIMGPEEVSITKHLKKDRWLTSVSRWPEIADVTPLSRHGRARVDRV